MLANQCQSWSAAVAVAAQPTSQVSSFQATAAAVNNVHADAAAAGVALAARLTSAATKLTAAAAHFTETDESSASDLAALGRGL